MKQELILENPGAQSGIQKITSVVLTTLFWGLWIYLWLPAYALLISETGIAGDYQFTGADPLGGGARELLFGVLIVALIMSLMLTAWALINRLRFRNRHRRTSTLAHDDSDLADFFKIDENKIARARKRKITTIHFDDRVLQVILTDIFIGELDPESSTYAVADLMVDGLRLRIRPNGAKRFVVQRDDNTSVVLGDFPQLSVDEARRQAAVIMAADHAAARKMRKYGKPVTVRDFMKRHYKPYSGANEPDPEVLDEVMSHFGPLQDLLLTEITSLDVTNWQSEMYAEGLHETIVVQRLELLRKVFNRAISWGAVVESPIKGIDIYHVPERTAA